MARKSRAFSRDLLTGFPAEVPKNEVLEKLMTLTVRERLRSDDLRQQCTRDEAYDHGRDGVGPFARGRPASR
jgi:hypothetical protein